MDADSQRHQNFMERLARFIKGSNKAENQEAFNLLFDFYSKKKHTREQLTPAEQEQTGEELFQRISQTANLRSRSPFRPVRTRVVHFSRGWWIAATLIFVLLAAGAGYLWVPQVKQYVSTWIRIEKKVPPGKREQYQLPDGTRVWLNSGSVLTYPRFFLGHSREVALSGEAFFRVEHDAEHPFIIHTDKIDTRVLGTSFNVNAYTQYGQTVVTVATGRVQVSKDDHVLSTLTANQEITVDNQSGRFSLTKQANTAARLAWRSGRLIFDNTPLYEVLATLANHYSVSFDTLQVNLNGQYLTAEFGADASLWQVLNVIIQINKLNFTVTKNTVVVSH